jgi:hypothetical protein
MGFSFNGKTFANKKPLHELCVNDTHTYSYNFLLNLFFAENLNFEYQSFLQKSFTPIRA